jgi:hypothetical protein
LDFSVLRMSRHFAVIFSVFMREFSSSRAFLALDVLEKVEVYVYSFLDLFLLFADGFFAIESTDFSLGFLSLLCH